MEEAVREKTRMVSMLQVRTKFLEEENSRLQDRIDSITQQKQGLDKLVKEYKLGKDSRDVHVSYLSLWYSHTLISQVVRDRKDFQMVRDIKIEK
jgi:hypothetical protein